MASIRPRSASAPNAALFEFEPPDELDHLLAVQIRHVRVKQGRWLSCPLETRPQIRSLSLQSDQRVLHDARRYAVLERLNELRDL
jgi:hypothetical protein